MKKKMSVFVCQSAWEEGSTLIKVVDTVEKADEWVKMMKKVLAKLKDLNNKECAEEDKYKRKEIFKKIIVLTDMYGISDLDNWAGYKEMIVE